MTTSELSMLRQEQLNIMDAIHEFCVKNQLQYYIIGGTLLGAVRHKGFIPWDIDIDIAMIREDYEKFRMTFDGAYENYECNSYHSDGAYLRPHMEVHNKKSHIVSRYDKFNKETMYRGIFVDVFPLDNVPQEQALREKQAKHVAKCKKKIYYKRVYCYKNEGFAKLFVKKLASLSLITSSRKSLCQKLDRAMRKYENDFSSGYICSMASHYSYKKQTMSIEYYGEPVLLEFDNRQYMAPARYHEYLTQLYGDYMTPPSKQQQIAQLEEFETIIMDKEG